MSTCDKTAVIYARVSTTRQAEEDLPIESQIEQCKSKAESIGARVDRIFVDEGKSGRTDERQAFQDAINYCEIVCPTYLVTWSTSRFSRNRIDASMYKLRLDKAGTDICYVSYDIDRSTDGGWVTEGVLELFDEFYSRQISADTTRSMINNARNGFFNGGRAPFGFVALPDIENPKRKRLRKIDSEALIVKDIFSMRINGMGAKTIAVSLQDRGIKNRDTNWTKSSVLALLRNDAVIGRVVFGRRDKSTKRIRPRDQWIVVQAHDPLISVDLWDSVQSLMDDATAGSNKGSPKSTYYFTGILRDEYSGSSFQIESGKSCTGKRYWYYNVRDAQKKGTARNRRISAREFDEWMVSVILDRILTTEFLQSIYVDLQDACGSWVQDHKRRRQSVVSSLSAIERKNSKIYELFEEYGKETPNLSDITRRLRANNDEIKRLEMQLMSIDAEQPPEISISDHNIDELAQTLRYIIETTENPKKLRHFFGTFISAIWVLDDSVRIEYRPECLIVNKEPRIVPSNAIWLPEHTLLGTLSLAVDLPYRFQRKVA